MEPREVQNGLFGLRPRHWTILAAIAIAGIMVLAKHRIAFQNAIENPPDAPGAPGEIATLHFDQEVNAVAFSGDGSHLAILSGLGSRVTIYDTQTWLEINHFDRDSGSYAFNSMAFLPNGHLVLTTHVGGYLPHPWGKIKWQPLHRDVDAFVLEELDLTSEQSAARPVRFFPNVPPDKLAPGIRPANTFALSDDSQTIAAINEAAVLIFDVKTGILIATVPMPELSGGFHEAAESLAFTRDGKSLAVGTAFGRVFIVDTKTWKIVHFYPLHLEYQIESLAFSPDGSLFATGRQNSNLRNPSSIGTNIWRTENGTAVTGLEGGTYKLIGKTNNCGVQTLKWTKHGNLLAVGDNCALRLWKFAGAHASLMMQRHAPVQSADFSSQDMLATATGLNVVIYR